MGLIKAIFNTIRDIKRNEKTAQKYINMTANELKALSDEELDDAVCSVLYFGADSENTEKYNAKQLTVIALKSFDSEVNNGGLCQFFVNSSSAYAPYVIEALNAVGAEQMSNKLKAFVSDNKIDLDDLSSFKCSSIDEFEEQEKRYPFDEFDDAYYAYYENTDINALVIKYARDNIEAVFEKN